MNWSHVHLMLNHVPVFGVLFGLVLFLAAKWEKSDELEKTSLVLFILMGAAAGVVYFTGEQAEVAVAQIPEISKALVLQHDDAAFYTVTAACILGGVRFSACSSFAACGPHPAGSASLCCCSRSSLAAW